MTAAPIAPGCFVTLEGIDGAGKSSHLAAIQAWLQAQGREVLTTREPRRHCTGRNPA